MKVKTLMKKGPNNSSINELICEKISLLRNNGKFATVHNYRGLLHFIERNFGILKAKDCDAAAVMRMKNLMSHLSTSTQASYLACLKSIWNYGHYIGVTGKTEYPFQLHAYEINKVKVPRIQRRTESYLTRDDMSKFYHYWLQMPTNNKFDISRKRYLGIFLFSYLGNGANINDILRLTYNTDWFNSNGRILSFIRHKTSDKSPVKVKIPITDWLKPILEYICEQPERNKPVFGSWLRGVDLNDEERLLKVISYTNIYCSKRIRHEAKILGIREDVSVTFARHSYSTVMHHAGAPFALVEKNLGHTGEGVAFNYIASFSDDDLFKWNEKLIV